MAGRSAFILLAVPATSGTVAEDARTLPSPSEPEHPHGFLSHGDSGDVLEDFFGSRVERKPPDDATAARKYDPAIRWDDRPIRR